METPRSTISTTRSIFAGTCFGASMSEWPASGSLVQLQTNDERKCPSTDATVRLERRCARSELIHVATLILPAQDLETRNQSAYGENLSFNTWRVLAEHEPVGSIAAARKVVYRASAEVRRDFNAIPTGEPAEPRPGEWKEGVPYPPAKDSRIVRAKIHPAIGMARVGNSPEHFIGPETIEPPSREKGFYRDSQGRLKRQAARFRIYGYNAAGEVVRELTTNWAKICWNVHVANRKAAWYQWTMALDVEEAKGQRIPRRNAHVKGDQRKDLVIDGRLKSIEGKGTLGPDYHFCGRCFSTDVYVGEIQTDESGRLVFLAGKGTSASPTHSPILPPGDNGFINADGWYDDVCDGPVTADVWIEGQPRSGGACMGRHGAAELRAGSCRCADALRPSHRLVPSERLVAVSCTGVISQGSLSDSATAERPAMGKPRLRGAVRTRWCE